MIKIRRERKKKKREREEEEEEEQREEKKKKKKNYCSVRLASGFKVQPQCTFHDLSEKGHYCRRCCISPFVTAFGEVNPDDDDELMLNVLRCHETY